MYALSWFYNELNIIWKLLINTIGVLLLVFICWPEYVYDTNIGQIQFNNKITEGLERIAYMWFFFSQEFTRIY